MVLDTPHVGIVILAELQDLHRRTARFKTG
jgi:hypothetical protein